jgi:hypothetical protein
VSRVSPSGSLDLQKRLRILGLAIGGLLVEVTDGTTDYNASRYRLSAFFDFSTVVNRLAFYQGHERASCPMTV